MQIYVNELLKIVKIGYKSTRPSLGTNQLIGIYNPIFLKKFFFLKFAVDKNFRRRSEFCSNLVIIN